MFEVVWGPDRGSYRGGGGLRVRQIGRELHTASYDPEQKRAKMGALGPPLFPPYVGFWRVSIQLKGHGFFIHSRIAKITKKKLKTKKNTKIKDNNYDLTIKIIFVV